MIDNNKQTQVSLGGIEPVTNAVGMLYNIGSGIANQVQNAANDKWNKQFAREQFDYQKSLNELLMAREDTAVQRRAKDLEAAGILKNLAAGSPAQSTAMSAGTSGAVANSNKQLQQMQKMDIMNSYAQFQLLNSEKDLNKARQIIELTKEGLADSEIAKNYAQALLAGKQGNVSDAQVGNINKDTELKQFQIVSIINDNKVKQQTIKEMEARRQLYISEKEQKDWDTFLSKVAGARTNDNNTVSQFKNLWGQFLTRFLADDDVNGFMKAYDRYKNSLFGNNEIRNYLKSIGVDNETDLYRLVQFARQKGFVK